MEWAGGLGPAAGCYDDIRRGETLTFAMQSHRVIYQDHKQANQDAADVHADAISFIEQDADIES